MMLMIPKEDHIRVSSCSECDSSDVDEGGNLDELIVKVGIETMIVDRQKDEVNLDENLLLAYDAKRDEMARRGLDQDEEDGDGDGHMPYPTEVLEHWTRFAMFL